MNNTALIFFKNRRKFKRHFNYPRHSMRLSSRSIIAILVILFVIIVDQLIKIEIKTTFSLYESVNVTEWFKLLFTENRGMAFGMQFIGTMILAIFRIFAIAFFVVVLTRYIKRKAPYGLIICLALVISGAAGNIIDNMFYGFIFSESQPYGMPAELVPFGQGYGSFLSGKVVDMFYFPLFTWPEWMPLVGGDIFFGAIFNFADAAISCGAVALALFYSKTLMSEGLLPSSK